MFLEAQAATWEAGPLEFALFQNAQAATGEVGHLEVAEAGPLELAVVARTLGFCFSSGGGLRERA